MTGMPGYQDVVALVGRGLAVFPLPAGSKAAGPGWQRRCTADLEVLARTWPDGANIGVGCRASNIVGVDLDRHGGGPTASPPSPRCAPCTGSRGRTRSPSPPRTTGVHLYFRVPPGLAAASAIGRWPGIDIRAPGYRTGGYLAGPGSVVDGAEYVIEHNVPAAPLPRWLAGLLTRRASVVS